MGHQDSVDKLCPNKEALSISVQLANQSDWQSPMMAAPTCTILIAKVMAMIVGTDDVSLLRYAPTNGFDYLIQPQSLRACMRQLCNATFDTMSNAEIKMYEISMASNAIPQHIRRMYDALTIYTVEEKNIIIPHEAAVVQREAEKCTEWAKEIRDQFTKTAALLNELLVCCEGTKGASEMEIKQKKIQKEKYEKMMQMKADALKKHKEMIDKNQEQHKQLQKEIESLSTAPTWETIFEVVHKAATIAVPVIHATLRPANNAESFFNVDMINAAATMAQVVQKQYASTTTTTAPTLAKREVDPLPALQPHDLQDLVAQLTKLHTLDLDAKECQESAVELTIKLDAHSSEHSIFVALNKYPLSIVKYAESTNAERATMKDSVLNEKATAQSQLQKLVSLAQKKEQAIQHNLEIDQERILQRAQANDRVKKLAINARILADSHAQVSVIEQRLAALEAQHQAMAQKLDIVNSSCTTIDDTIATLKQVLDLLTELKLQWDRMVIFFQTTASSVAQASTEVTKMASLMQSVHTAPALSSALTESIIGGCITAHGHTKYIHLISSMYKDISNEFFTHDLATLPRILQMSPDEAKAEIKRREERLIITHNGIKEKVSKKHSQMTEFMQKHAHEGRKLYIAQAPISQRKVMEDCADAIEAEAAIHASNAALAMSEQVKYEQAVKKEYEGDPF